MDSQERSVAELCLAGRRLGRFEQGVRDCIGLHLVVTTAVAVLCLVRMLEAPGDMRFLGEYLVIAAWAFTMAFTLRRGYLRQEPAWRGFMWWRKPTEGAFTGRAAEWKRDHDRYVTLAKWGVLWYALPILPGALLVIGGLLQTSTDEGSAALRSFVTVLWLLFLFGLPGWWGSMNRAAKYLKRDRIVWMSLIEQTEAGVAATGLSVTGT